MDDRLLEPVKAYGHFESKFTEEAEAYLDDLVRRSGVNVEQNRATVREYRKQSDSAASAKRETGRLKTGKAFLIVLSVFGFLAVVIGIFAALQKAVLTAVLCIVLGLIAGIVPILVIKLVLSPKIKHGEERIKLHEDKAAELLREAYGQMDPLNSLFDSDITHKLIQKTVPQITLDRNFDMRRYDYLSGKYGFGDNDDEARSTIAVLTGEILGNPFVVDREFVRTMGTATYTGSITIHWTTTSTDSEGHTVTQHHSETLTASITRPKPFYSEQTRLIYGNEAAPDLSFSHDPSHAERFDEKALEKKVKSGEKKLSKLQEKAVKAGKPFTVMGNAKFDVLFGALDRDNEVQFRLLFTPLGQKNMLELMTSRVGYGDDFSFRKRKCLNYISSEHSANWDLDTDYHRYRSYDYDLCVRNFKSFNLSYFKSLYFDLAPLLSIPLYQQHKPVEYIYKDLYPRNYTSYEAERSVNRMGQRNFAPELAGTPSILKTEFVGKEGRSDMLAVTAHAFNIVPRVEYVSKWGGDGNMHSIPVEWDDYVPVERETLVRLKELNVSDKEFEGMKSSLEEIIRSGSSYSNGLLCALMEAGVGDFDAAVDKAFADI